MKRKMQVGGSPTTSKKSRNVAIGTLVTGALAGIGNEVRKARTEKLKKKYNEAAIAASESGTGKGDAMAAKEKYARKLQKRGYEMDTMKTGGMVNSNAKVSALKSAGSKGVKSGVNPKASASRVTKGKTGGISKAPRTASPKRK